MMPTPTEYPFVTGSHLPACAMMARGGVCTCSAALCGDLSHLQANPPTRVPPESAKPAERRTAPLRLDLLNDSVWTGMEDDQ